MIHCHRSANAAVTANLQEVVELIDDPGRAGRKQKCNQEQTTMIRLFEALNNVEAKRRSQGVVPLTMAPPGVVRPETTAVEAAQLEPAQELEREHRS